MKRKITMMLLFAVLMLAGCVESYESKEVEGVVVHKEYDAPTSKKKKTTVNGQTKTKIVREPAEWEVTIKYNDIEQEFEFDDSDFYDSVEEGDTVLLNLVKGLDKNGKVVSERIELAKNDD